MSEYCPDRWCIIRINSEEFGITDKVFSGNYGGYCGSDTWKMNSGIVKVDDLGEYYNITGLSGSLYKCYKQAEGMSGYMTNIFAVFEDKQFAGKFTINCIEVKDIVCLSK